MNTNKIYFTPGPSALYFTVEDHMRNALRKQVPSISHRSKQFSAIYQDAELRLRSLIGLPDNFYVFFTASATEIWERLLQSCVETSSLHLVNGAFSKRFYEIAHQLGVHAIKAEAEMGQVVSPDKLNDQLTPDLVAVTHNETSTGAQQPLQSLGILRKMYPNALLTVDVVSSFPNVDLPFQDIDSAYFSVQKGMGLPAGLGVWILNDRCIEHARKLEHNHRSSYHGIMSLWEKYQKYQTPATPNVLGIYLLGQVLGDMQEKGLERIRMEGKYKAALLYQLMESHHGIEPFVAETDWRSQTVAVGCTGDQTERLIRDLDDKGLVVGNGYGPFKNQHIRIANFPTHSKEQVEMLVDQLDLLLDHNTK